MIMLLTYRFAILLRVGRSPWRIIGFVFDDTGIHTLLTGEKYDECSGEIMDSVWDGIRQHLDSILCQYKGLLARHDTRHEE